MRWQTEKHEGRGRRDLLGAIVDLHFKAAYVNELHENPWEGHPDD